MRKHTIMLSIAVLGLWLSAAPSQASTVIPTPPGHQSGQSYEWGVTMGANDSATYSGSVGAKSWAEPGNPDTAPGWTHTSDWTVLDLTGTGGPTTLTLTLDRGATGSLFPAFSIYSGVEDVNSDAENHTFNNTGNIGWATNLTFVDNTANGGGPLGTDSGTGLPSVSDSWVLEPGMYTLNFGGNPPNPPGQSGTHAFTATLTTAQAAVPVPAALWLFGSGLAGLVGLARRRIAA